jgi:transcriptional regulator NrdR family protein
MTCPKCEEKVKVIDVTNNTDDNETYRIRQCRTCGHKFYTVEMEVEANTALLDIWTKFNRCYINLRNRKVKKNGN